MGFLNEICAANEIDEKLHNLVVKDVNEYFENYTDREFLKKGDILSKSVFLQIETAL